MPSRQCEGGYDRGGPETVKDPVDPSVHALRKSYTSDALDVPAANEQGRPQKNSSADDLENSDQTGSRRTTHRAEQPTRKVSRHDRAKNPDKRGPKRG